MPGCPPTERRQAAVKLYRMGWRPADIARRLNTSRANIYRMLDRARYWEDFERGDMVDFYLDA